MGPNLGTAYVRIAPNMTGIQGKIASGMRGTGTKASDDFAGEFKSRGSSVITGAVAGVAAAAASKAMTIIGNSIGSAIKRVDTLNASAKTFEYMGFGAEEAEKATERLNKSITGLPTPLDSAMRGMSGLAATYGDITKGERVFSSLNNAILGFGGDANMVENAVTQLSQLPLDGPLDAQTWNSLRNSGLTPLLVAMSKDMGMSVSDMKEAFGSGELTVQDFTDKLVEMNSKGGGGLESLEKIARNATGGIGTGMANMQTSVTRGVAKIIDAIGSERIAAAFGVMGKGFETVLSAVATTVPPIIETIGSIIGFIVKHKDIFAPIAVGIGAIVAAFTAWRTAITVWQTVTKIATAVQTAFNAVMAANPIGLIALAIIGLVAGLTYFFTQTELGKQVWQGLMDFIGSALTAIGGFFAGAWNFIKGIWSAVTGFFAGVWQGIVNIFNAVVGFYSGIFSAAWNIIKGIWSAVAGWFGGVWRGIVGVFSGVAGWFGGIFRGAWNNITNLFGNLGRWFGDRFNDIKNAFGNVGQIGKDIVTGLWNGISNMAGWVIGKIKGFAGDVLGGIKSFFGIKSPSREFAEVGRDNVRGLAKGFTDNIGLVTRAVDKVASEALGGMGAVDSALAAGFNSSAQVSQSIAVGDYETPEKIIINVNAKVNEKMDLNQLASDLGYAVAMA